MIKSDCRSGLCLGHVAGCNARSALCFFVEMLAGIQQWNVVAQNEGVDLVDYNLR